MDGLLGEELQLEGLPAGVAELLQAFAVGLGELVAGSQQVAGEAEGVAGEGVPALAVLESDGKVVFAQKQGEFESMRKMDPSSVADFLRKWAK